MSVADLASVSRSTLREQVLSNLRDAIVSGRLAPGARLAEVDLAAQLGVSRGTVREALRTLQQSGLVTEADRGLCVRRPTAREIQEIFSVRAGLEALAVAEIMATPDRDDRLDQLEAVLPHTQDAPASYLDRVTRDLGFHERLCELSENGVLLETWQLLKDRMLVVILSDPERTSKPIMSREHHVPILDAMRSGDVAAAQQEVQDHMGTSAALWIHHAEG